MADVPLVLVTGATGALGPAVVREALARGRRVRTLARRMPEDGLLPPGVDAREGDIRDQRIRRAALEGADVVLHLAALLHVTSRSQQARCDYDGVNATATKALVDDAAEAGVRRVVLFSSIAVYGHTAGIKATEDSPVCPTTAYARSKLRAEAAVLQGPHKGDAGVVLRLAAAYGPRVRGNYRTLVRHLARGRPLPILPGANCRTLVFDEDAARAALLAAEHPTAVGRIFNVTDGSVHSLADITAAICAALGRRAPAFGVPVELARAALRPARPLLRGPLARVAGLVDKYAEETAVDGTRIQIELGFSPRVNLNEGWRRTVEGLRREGL